MACLAGGSALAQCAVDTSAADCASEPGACRWTFDLGTPQSRDIYDGLRAALAGCSDARPERDQGVNHPDFYDAWAFQIDGARVTLSIKDKSALGKTYVVLRGPMSEMRRN